MKISFTVFLKNSIRSLPTLCAILLTLPLPVSAQTVTLTPSAGMLGRSVLFSGTISNSGAEATGRTISIFPNIFQVALGTVNANGEFVANTTAAIIPADDGPSGLGVNDSVSGISGRFTFPSFGFSVGTYHVRLCTNFEASSWGPVNTYGTSDLSFLDDVNPLNDGWGGSILEAVRDRNNNCGEWKAFTVYPDISASCAVAPATGFVGDDFNWTVGSVTGGNHTYTYDWSGSDGLSKTTADTIDVTDSVAKSYSATGLKSAEVKVTSAGYSRTFACTNSATVLLPLSVAVSPTSYTVTLPSRTVSVTYTLTNGTSANTKCRLLDNAGTPLTAYASCNGSMSVSAPAVAGTYGYSIQANKSSTGETKTSNSFTVAVSALPVLSTSCSVTPTSGTPGSTGTTFTWAIDKKNDGSYVTTGGDGSYTYSWHGTDSLAGPGTSVTKKYAATGTKTASITVTSAGASQTFDCSNSASVNVLPDLTASLDSPTAPAAAILALGTATFTATISNAYAPTPLGVSFTNLLQMATDASGTGATDVGTFPTLALPTAPALPIGGTASDSFDPMSLLGAPVASASRSSSAASVVLAFDFTPLPTFTPPSGGNYYLRVCADKNSSGSTGTIKESNEDNNCSAWRSVVGPTTVSDTCASGTDFVSGACRERLAITATQAPNGAIAPPGTTSLTYGTSQSYAI
ncbi:hypothetical protein HY415_01035, partial [Candidatus Kaiserbacteria bacterium]|nr:hypothetical protein [Candidatus Kaiserbacteria bacterium]